MGPEFEAVAILTLDGEVLDHVGKPIDYTWVKDMITLLSMFLTTNLDTDDVRDVEIRLGDRDIVLVIDPPLVRVGIVRRRR